ncbi:MAG: LysM peptidoglycan-binding domain-containing protein [Umezawaea sp.]
MAVLIGTRSGFELVDADDLREVSSERGLRPGPRVLRRFEVGDGRRPASRAKRLSVPATPDAIECGPERRERGSALRLVGVCVLAVVLAACLGLLYLYASGATGVPERTGVAYVQVGETLHDVAVRSAPDSDPDAVVERIRELNRLADADVLPGQSLVVPQGVVEPAP